MRWVNAATRKVRHRGSLMPRPPSTKMHSLQEDGTQMQNVSSRPLRTDTAIVERAHELHKKRYTTSQAAKEIGVHAHTLREWAKRDNWGAWALPHQQNWDRKPEVYRLFDSGMNRLEIAQKTGLTYHIVKAWIKERADLSGKPIRRDCRYCKERDGCRAKVRTGLPSCCEEDICIDGLPESKLYSRNGGARAIDGDYGWENYGRP
jgi:transposase